MSIRQTLSCLMLSAVCVAPTNADEPTAKLPYAIVDTGQTRCYDERRETEYPKPGDHFYGQDAQYQGNAPEYRDNGDGTITDLVTGLMWQADPGGKKSYDEAVAGAAKCQTAGYQDWRLPTIKELYSLIQFTGTDPDPTSRDSSRLRPFIDTNYFQFRYGQASDGDRIIDSQWATSTVYVDRVMFSMPAMFGVNFADGRIKGYPTGRTPRGDAKTFYVIYVRGNTQYGANDYVDHGDGTITDRATGLEWMKVDSISLNAGPRHDGKLDWREALAWAESLEYAGHSDWRLPNAKELHSLVDYGRSPSTTSTAAIDPMFQSTAIRNEGDLLDFGQYWTSTTHASVNSGDSAVYICFGRGLGFMAARGNWTGTKQLLDVHGAGAQRCDPKLGDASRFVQGRGPQGDVVRIYNLVRCVRGGTAEPVAAAPESHTANARPAAAAGRQPPSGGGRGVPGEQWVRRLDRDGDHQVSRQEFDGPVHHFSDFDRNNDGQISPDEAPQGPPRR
ncbi:Lcl domain-containing protein [Aeoliella mucimassa]|uniref:Lcl C-terminal domain-containing protein n=1 Tax=Aeoliella mucimassa TaxID=2527972 RepID=A0A518AMI6_9BACT|nr:DUF1566 domain-containing protein [Aeoliella mucimassa]QDU55923.1 hypothetical protein Pan181_21250 [Aeoliella mucimassa]